MLRDITEDLKDRIKAEMAKKEPLETALAAIDKAIKVLTETLALEQSRSMNGAANGVTTARRAPEVGLETYIMKALASGPKTLEQLRDSAKEAGYFEGGGAPPGRQVHAKLLNHIVAKRVTRTEDKKYQLHQ